MWQSTAPARSTAGSQSRRRVRNENASAPRNPRASARASENEYSPARALTIGPPMMRWLNWIVASWVPGDAVTPLKNRKRVVETAKSSGPGRRTFSPRPNPYGAQRHQHETDRRDQLERDVVRHHEVEEHRQQRRHREVELAGREAGEPVRRPAGDPPVRQEMVPEVRREPDVRPHVAAVGGRVPQQQGRVELPEHDHAAREDDHDAEPAPSQAEVPIRGWEHDVGGAGNVRCRPGIGRERLRRELAHRHPLSMAAAARLSGSLRASLLRVASASYFVPAPRFAPAARPRAGARPLRQGRRRAPSRSRSGDRPPENFGKPPEGAEPIQVRRSPSGEPGNRRRAPSRSRSGDRPPGILGAIG